MASHGQTSGLDATRNIGCSQASQRPRDECVNEVVAGTLSAKRTNKNGVREAGTGVCSTCCLTD